MTFPELRRRSAEACRRGKPDEMDLLIADRVGALILEVDPAARFDLRVSGRYNGGPHVDLGGEISKSFLHAAKRNYFWEKVEDRISRDYSAIHRQSTTVNCHFDFTPQSTELTKNRGAGDEGEPIAVAFLRTPNHLPWERFLAFGIRDLLDDIYRKDGSVPEHLASPAIEGLRADGKIKVRALYNGLQPRIDEVVVALQHEPSKRVGQLRREVTTLVNAYINHLSNEYDVDLGKPRIFVNGAGSWYEGGWKADRGSREAKPQREFFGAWGLVDDSGGGQFPFKISPT